MTLRDGSVAWDENESLCACLVTSWIEPLRVPGMPPEMMSVVLALATTQGNISAHLACNSPHVVDQLDRDIQSSAF